MFTSHRALFWGERRILGFRLASEGDALFFFFGGVIVLELVMMLKAMLF